MESPNRLALDLVDEAIDFAEELNVGIHHLQSEAAVLDFGVDYPGGVEAGLLLSEIATGGLATVQSRVGTVHGAALTHVELSTDHPAIALLGCQSPGWEFDVGGTDAYGYGPAQLFRTGAASGWSPDPHEESDFAVLAVESDRLPGEPLVEDVASVAGLPPSAVFVLVAPANSVAGSVAGAARAAERAVDRLVSAGYDRDDVSSVTASAPVPPLAPTEAESRARAIAAVAAGGRVHLHVRSDVDDPESVAGAAADDATAPAQVTLDVADGPTRVVGRVDEERLAADLGL